LGVLQIVFRFTEVKALLGSGGVPDALRLNFRIRGEKTRRVETKGNLIAFGGLCRCRREIRRVGH